ncbi:MAG TPA: hypothetical protein VGI03_04675 [Verrucomicrobiae bacterium]|jgi:hypothetical protein
MTLREFVADTLNQITEGVGDARGENKQVAPPVFQHSGSTSYCVLRGGVAHPSAFLVEFDVAVTVSKKTNVDAGGGVLVHVFEAGINRKTSAEHSTVNRIKFQVPVTYDA